MPTPAVDWSEASETMRDKDRRVRQTRGWCLPKRGFVVLAVGLAALAVLPAAGQLQGQVANGPVGQGDTVAGKENNQNVFVRDSAIAQEKFENAKKMERQKQWNNAASFYQEVLEKYAGRVVPSGVDKNGVIVQYTSIANGVRERLCHWPREGLEVYRSMNEPKAAALLEKAQKAVVAGQDDSFDLHELLRLYFVTESGKAAALRLTDEKLERGEFSAAAWLGDDLLNMHPNLLAERPAVLFRTALAYHLAGNEKAAADRAATLAAKFPNEMGVVRGKDAILTQALAQEMAQSPVAASAAAIDSWPMPGGNPQRDLIPTAHGNPGTRLSSIPLSKPDYKNLAPQQKTMLLQQIEANSQSGAALGVLPSADRGELFFQDGMRAYGVSLESGVPLPGWAHTYGERQGQYVLPNVWGSTRGHQQAITVADHQVLAVMGQPDYSGIQFGVQPAQGEARLVCLNRETGRENWVVAPTTMKDVPRNDDEKAVRALQLSGSPLVVGDNVLVIGRSNKQGQGDDCYVLAFDLSNGHYRWGCYIASSGMGVNVMWGMQQFAGNADNTSHLAYANGRVYVLTNLGAVAALDAYSGTIVWLNIYPSDKPAPNAMMMRGGFNPMFANGGSMGNTGRLKPWMFNPVVVHDGKLFVLPTEGNNLLIYDAGSGHEEKRISLDQLSHWHLKGITEQADKPTTLVGVTGDRLVLAGESRVLCLDWRKYDEETFPGPNDEMIVWPSVAPFGIRGRCFMTTDAVFIPGFDRLLRVDMKTGSVIDVYPRYPRTWEDGESPGNVLVSGDHVVVAGSAGVNIYTDLEVATAKLDREIAAAPLAPDLRLRYAEVMYVAGRGDDALSRLDESVALMGGEQALAAAGPGNNRDRLFSDALTFATKSAGDERPGTRERVAKFFDRAARAAYSPQQQVTYRIARAKFEAAGRDPAAAVKLYQQILADRQMRAISLPDTGSDENAPGQAEDAAEKAIDTLVRACGPDVYAAYQQAAEKEVADAQALKGQADPMAEKLLSIAQAYPNSSVAPQAMLAAADAYESAVEPRQAIRVLRQMWFKYAQQGTSRVQIAEALARNYLAVSDRNRSDMVTTAASRLALAASLPGDPKLSQDMKLPDGRVLPAGTTFTRALDEVRAVHGKETDKALPDFHLPQPPSSTQMADGAKYPKPFLNQPKRGVVPAGAAAVLPGVSALVMPERDFARPDRVVAWGGGAVSIFPAGRAQPLAVAKAFPDSGHGNADAPRGVAWVGDAALIWGSSKLIRIDASAQSTGKERGSQEPVVKELWNVDLTQLGTLEVAHANDGGGLAVAGAVEASGLNVNINPMIIRRNGLRQQIFINGGGNVVFQGGGVVVPQGVPAPQPKPAAGQDGAEATGEQVVEVRPIGDRILVSTSTGRLLSAELGTGRVAWQTRLAERPIDRLVATEDFTVAKVSDETTCRLFALDTYTGRVLGTKPFALVNNNNAGFAMAPVNIALSADGTLVYTLPDRLCLKDLYKPWNDEEKTIAGPPGQAMYLGASLPGQLVVSEGRILALADNAPNTNIANQKWVRVHSLETGQPLSLKYDAPDGARRVIDRVLTAETKDWNVLLRVVGPHLYVVGPNSVFAYNLDKPGETWKGQALPSNDGPQSDVNFRDVFVGQQHLVLLDQPPSAVAVGNGDPTELRLLAFGRRPARENDPNSGESGRLDYPVSLTDPAGIQPNWQACDGGFYYATDDGKIHMLLGAK